MEELPRYSILGSTVLFPVLIYYVIKLVAARNNGPKLSSALSTLSATLQDAFLRHPKGVFEINTSEGSEFVTSREAFEEMKGWSDDNISVQLGLQSFVQSRYTGQYPPDELLNTAIKADLSPNLNWLDAILDYTEKLFVGVEAVKKIHPSLRPILGHFIPEIRRISQVRRRCANHIDAVLKRRSHSHEGEYDDMLHWIIKRSQKAGTHNAMELATLQLSLSMAAVHSTSMTITNM
ncbi:Cytochrome P450 [Macrophomina phaseolina MS6]|uniref:Cytochrome P450 n=1 Tax=Macrophomina phaseolina (strain MS6) TaxID=1126212 RepID=K2SA69_MACPH|nr:Cytochrome P450 [Macrophomina phaseolina MS6]